MFHTTNYLLICTMILTTAMCGELWSTPQRGIGYQCKNRGRFVGACKASSQNEYQGELICSSLACATRKKPPHFARYTGPAEDGTPCGREKVCQNGECVFGNPSNPERYINGTMVNCIFKRPSKKPDQSLYKKALEKSLSPPPDADTTY